MVYLACFLELEALLWICFTQNRVFRNFLAKTFFGEQKYFFSSILESWIFSLKPIFEKIDDFLRNPIEILQNRLRFRTDLVENVC